MIMKYLTNKKLMIIVVLAVVAIFGYSYVSGSWVPGQMVEETIHGPREYISVDIEGTFYYTHATGTISRPQWTLEKPFVPGLFWAPRTYKMEMDYTYRGNTVTQVGDLEEVKGLLDSVPYSYTLNTKIWRFQDDPNWENDYSQMRMNDWSYTEDESITFDVRIYAKGPWPLGWGLVHEYTTTYGDI